MPTISRWIRRHKLLTILSAIIIVLVVIFTFSTTIGPKEVLVASKTILVPAAQNATDTFTHTGSAVNESMITGCNVPASMKLYTQSVTSTGDVNIYINDVLYATGTISDTGYVKLTSGCGCSTVCICEIKIGDNTIEIVSQGFEGEVKYEIYVKS